LEFFRFISSILYFFFRIGNIQKNLTQKKEQWLIREIKTIDEGITIYKRKIKRNTKSWKYCYFELFIGKDNLSL